MRVRVRLYKRKREEGCVCGTECVKESVCKYMCVCAHVRVSEGRFVAFCCMWVLEYLSGIYAHMKVVYIYIHESSCMYIYMHECLNIIHVL